MMYLDKIIDLKEKIKQLKNREEELKLPPIVDVANKYMYDPDASLCAWQYYLVAYKDILPFNGKEQVIEDLFQEKFPSKNDKTSISFWNTFNSYRRIIGTFEYKKEEGELKRLRQLNASGLEVGKNIGIGGDCTFNFNEKKVPIFWKIIDRAKDMSNDENLKKELKELLLLCSLMHHSVYNFTLMPTNGNMQAVKGGKQGDVFDRLGVVLNKMDNFYRTKGKDDLILNQGSGNNVIALKDFLNTIGSLESYCKIFYHLDDTIKYKDNKRNDKTLLEAIKESGQLEMNTCNDILEYISIAVRFWEHQADNYEKQKNNIK